MGVANSLAYEGSESSPFGMDKVQQLCSVLPLCGNLKELHLRGCELGGEGMAMLAESLHYCRNLEYIQLDDCRLGREDAAQLASLMRSLPKLASVWARSNYFSNEDISMLSQECKHRRLCTCEF